MAGWPARLSVSNGPPAVVGLVGLAGRPARLSASNGPPAVVGLVGWQAGRLS